MNPKPKNLGGSEMSLPTSTTQDPWLTPLVESPAVYEDGQGQPLVDQIGSIAITTKTTPTARISDGNGRLPFLRTPYNYDVEKVSQLTGLLCEDPSLTQQQFAEQADINYIVKQFGLTGELPDKYQAPNYADFEGVFDYQSAQHAMIDADRRFMAMPAELRYRFGNTPQGLIEFLSDPKNAEESVKLGLRDAKTPIPTPPPQAASARPPEPSKEPEPKP